MNDARISKWQFLIILLICRIFTLMTFVPLVPEGSGFTVQLAAAAISTVIQAIIIIPLVMFNKVCPDKTVTYAIKEKNKPLGCIISVVYLIFFLTYAINGAVHFMRFLEGRFFGGGSSAVMTFIFLCVCVYCAYCGIEGLCRSSAAVLLFFAVMMIVMGASSYGNFNAENFCLYNIGDSLFRAVMDDLAKNSEITAAAFLIRHTGKGLKCGIYGLLAAKLAITEIISAMIIGVLGGYSELTDYPLMEVGSYSDSELFQRNDSLYLILWTLSAVITVSLFISISSELAKELIPSLKLRGSVMGAFVFIVSAVFLYYGADFTVIRGYVCGGISTIVLVGVIPLILYLCTKGKKTNEKKS